MAFLPDFVTMIDWCGMRQLRYAACIWEMGNACNILFGKPKRQRTLIDLDVDRRIKLTWILGK
jgi:hypothetical protein